MKLSQRLTRAGLAFILLGSVAAVMPHNDAAQATTVNCTGGPTTQYRLTDNSDGNDNSSAYISRSARTSVKLYTFISTDSGATFSPTNQALFVNPNDIISFASSGDTTSATSPASVYPNSENSDTGSSVVTTTFHDGSTRYNVTFNIGVSS